MIRRLLRRTLCAVGDHEWTCKAEQGIEPSPQRMAEDPFGYFAEYSRGYCLHCGERMDERAPGVSVTEALVVLLLTVAVGLVVANDLPVQEARTVPAVQTMAAPSELYYGPPRDTSAVARLCCRVLPEVR